MEYYELACTVCLRKDIYFNQTNEAIGQAISRIMLRDKELMEKHKLYGYKFYTFNSLYPIEYDKIYHQGRVYVFKIRSLDKNFIDKIRQFIFKSEDETFRFMSAEKRRVIQRCTQELYTVTPVVVTLNDKPWLAENDIILLGKRLQANLEKKFKSFFGKSLQTDQCFIQKIQILNQKPYVYKYKGIGLLANKFRIILNEDDASQSLAHIALACGLGEKNSSLGAGFCTGR